MIYLECSALKAILKSTCEVEREIYWDEFMNKKTPMTKKEQQELKKLAKEWTEAHG